MDGTGEMKINDGGGLFDSPGLIDSLIVDCERGMKALLAGSPLEYAATTVGMVQKLGELKKGIKNEKEGLEKQIRELTELLEKGGQDGKGAGFVCDPLDGALGGGEERLRDAVLPEGGGLEQDPGDAGA